MLLELLHLQDLLHFSKQIQQNDIDPFLSVFSFLILTNL